ncbi:hypothetical protein Hanom_Chr15g01339731 [Helianthus anomalus]
MNYQTQTNTFTIINERMWTLFMSVHFTKRTKFLVSVCLFNKWTNTNKLPAKQFTNYPPNIWFVYTPTSLPHLLKNSCDYSTFIHQGIFSVSYT